MLVLIENDESWVLVWCTTFLSAVSGIHSRKHTMDSKYSSKKKIFFSSRLQLLVLLNNFAWTGVAVLHSRGIFSFYCLIERLLSPCNGGSNKPVLGCLTERPGTHLVDQCGSRSWIFYAFRKQARPFRGHLNLHLAKVLSQSSRCRSIKHPHPYPYRILQRNTTSNMPLTTDEGIVHHSLHQWCVYEIWIIWILGIFRASKEDHHPWSVGSCLRPTHWFDTADMSDVVYIWPYLSHRNLGTLPESFPCTNAHLYMASR